MIEYFVEGARYRNRNANDLDIQVTKIIDENENHVTITINYIYRTNNQILNIVKDDLVNIRKTDFKYWEKYG